LVLVSLQASPGVLLGTELDVGFTSNSSVRAPADEDPSFKDVHPSLFKESDDFSLGSTKRQPPHSDDRSALEIVLMGCCGRGCDPSGQRQGSLHVRLRAGKDFNVALPHSLLVFCQGFVEIVLVIKSGISFACRTPLRRKGEEYRRKAIFRCGSEFQTEEKVGDVLLRCLPGKAT